MSMFSTGDRFSRDKNVCQTGPGFYSYKADTLSRSSRMSPGRPPKKPKDSGQVPKNYQYVGVEHKDEDPESYAETPQQVIVTEAELSSTMTNMKNYISKIKQDIKLKEQMLKQRNSLMKEQKKILCKSYGVSEQHSIQQVKFHAGIYVHGAKPKILPVGPGNYAEDRSLEFVKNSQSFNIRNSEPVKSFPKFQRGQDYGSFLNALVSPKDRFIKSERRKKYLENVKRRPLYETPKVDPEKKAKVDKIKRGGGLTGGSSREQNEDILFDSREANNEAYDEELPVPQNFGKKEGFEDDSQQKIQNIDSIHSNEEGKFNDEDDREANGALDNPYLNSEGSPQQNPFSEENEPTEENEPEYGSDLESGDAIENQ